MTNPLAMQHADELLQVLQSDPLRRESGLKRIADRLHARFSIEHTKDGVFFFMKAKVVETDGSLTTQ